MRYEVTIGKPSCHGILDLKGRHAQLADWAPTASFEFPSVPNTFTKSGSVAICWIGPQHWLLHTDLAHENQLKSIALEVDMPDTISALMLSDALSFFTISGVDATQVLSIATPLDIHRSVFPDNAVSYTEAFGLKALILRCADGFELAVESSFSDMLDDYLHRAVGS